MKTSTASPSITPPKSFANPSFSRPSPAAWASPHPAQRTVRRATSYLRERGGEVSLRTSVDASCPPATAGSPPHPAAPITRDAVVLALSFEAPADLLPVLPETGKQSLAADLAQFEHSPITGIHLWFDREITDLDHAVLLDTTIQWMFNKSKLQPSHRDPWEGSYIELVVSASRTLVPMQRQEIIDLALRELAQFFPAVASARLVKAASSKKSEQPTRSARFLIDPPAAASPWPGIFLAGDWTATGWPSTMEGAVRSGYLAASAVTRTLGGPQDFVAPELSPSGLMKLFRSRSR